jgi:biotin carboxyl carrier protein
MASPQPQHHGETLTVSERVVIAPAVGVFRPALHDTGGVLREGDEIGVIEALGTLHPVCTPFDGTFMGMLAHPGERMRAGQPVAWLRVA